MSNEKQDMDRIIGLDNDNGVVSPEIMAELAGEKPKLQPKVPAPKAAATEAPKDDELSILNKKIRDMEAGIKLLVEGRDGIKLKAAKIERKPVDWNKITERDIFDLECPIDIINHDMPDYMLVESADSNYVLRWVQKMPRRLGPMKAMGYQFCQKEHIKGELNIAIEENASGQFQFDDVILMRIEKRIYYGMLRRNHERAIKMVDPKAAHKTAQERVINDMRNTSDGSGEFDKRVAANQLSVYSPHFDL